MLEGNLISATKKLNLASDFSHCMPNVLRRGSRFAMTIIKRLEVRSELVNVYLGKR